MFAIIFRKQLLVFAGLIMGSSIAVIAMFGLNLGIDFTGGALTEVAYEEVVEKTAVEAVATEIGLKGFSVRGSVDETGRNAYIIRSEDLNEDQRIAFSESLVALGEGGEVTRFTTIGPVIGKELKDKAGWAILGVVSIIVLYVAFAFAGIGTPVSSWVYGGITILVLIHDVLVPSAVMSLMGQYVGIEVDILFVMALLAILGYSVNDTIIVFDRVRENLKQNRTEERKKHTEPGGLVREEVTYTLTKPYEEIVGEAVSQTLTRSINTSLTTAVTLVALYFFGGAVTQTFTLILLVGVLAGTYSSICIAGPLVVAYAGWKAKTTQSSEKK
jgi:preprotein translocase subunit SecF